MMNGAMILDCIEVQNRVRAKHPLAVSTALLLHPSVEEANLQAVPICNVKRLKNLSTAAQKFI